MRAGSNSGTPMSTVTWPSASSRGTITPRQRADADFGLVGEPLVAHEAHEAARAVAALLDLAAVGVEDAVAEIGAGARGGLDQQDLVAADAEMAVGDPAHLLAAKVERDARQASSTTKSLPSPAFW